MPCSRQGNRAGILHFIGHFHSVRGATREILWEWRPRCLSVGQVIAALTLGLAVAAVPGVATASTAPGHTIASAGKLTIGDAESGGGGAIDFWTVHLTGGDQLQFSTGQPDEIPGTAINTDYVYQLYRAGTTGTSFPGAVPLGSAATAGTAVSKLVLQAPYTATFILAVCENPGGANCSHPPGGSTQNPMQPYTFTTKLIKSSGTRASAVDHGNKVTT